MSGLNRVTFDGYCQMILVLFFFFLKRDSFFFFALKKKTKKTMNPLSTCKPQDIQIGSYYLLILDI